MVVDYDGKGAQERVAMHLAFAGMGSVGLALFLKHTHFDEFGFKGLLHRGFLHFNNESPKTFRLT